MNFTKGLTITSWSICIFLFAGSLTEDNQLEAQQRPNADSLFAQGDWPNAAVEFERRIYTGANAFEKTKALISKSKCLRNQEKYDAAFEATKRIPYDAINDTLIVSARYESALAAYLGGNFSMAESELVQMQFYVTDSTLYADELFLQVLVLNEQRKWNESKEVFMRMVQLSNASQEEKKFFLTVADSLYNPENYPKLKKKEVAANWARYLPGAGHLYAGFAGEGIMNLTLQLASIGFMGYNFFIHHYVTTFTVGSGMLQHFYFGGINRAQFLVEKRNYLNQQKYNVPLKQKTLEIQAELYTNEPKE
jgi:hypothetical protein